MTKSYLLAASKLERSVATSVIRKLYSKLYRDGEQSSPCTACGRGSARGYRRCTTSCQGELNIQIKF